MRISDWISDVCSSDLSTLTACLVHNGWRLLSDEMALVSLQDGGLTALARPISLKTRSIDPISDILPNAALRARSEATVTGAVALFKPPTTHVELTAKPARPAWVISPTYNLGATPRTARRPTHT